MRGLSDQKEQQGKARITMSEVAVIVPLPGRVGRGAAVYMQKENE